MTVAASTCTTASLSCLCTACELCSEQWAVCGVRSTGHGETRLGPWALGLEPCTLPPSWVVVARTADTVAWPLGMIRWIRYKQEDGSSPCMTCCPPASWLYFSIGYWVPAMPSCTSVLTTCPKSHPFPNTTPTANRGAPAFASLRPSHPDVDGSNVQVNVPLHARLFIGCIGNVHPPNRSSGSTIDHCRAHSIAALKFGPCSLMRYSRPAHHPEPL